MKNAKSSRRKGSTALWWHRWPALVASVIVVLISVSGIVLNHRAIFSGADVSRSLLPPGYQYQNWNLGALRGSYRMPDGTQYWYGNIGVWKTDSTLSSFVDMNHGFRQGIDNRKTEAMALTNRGVLLAATLSGLYQFDNQLKSWQLVRLPLPTQKIVDVVQKNDSTLILTRSELLITRDFVSFSVKQLPALANSSRSVSLFTSLWLLHSGGLFGISGRILVDVFGLVLIVMAVTGIFHFFLPGFIKRSVKGGQKPKRIVSIFKFNLKWHNKLGWIFALFFILIAITGMFLRPPLLIPIANVRVGVVPFTEMDTPNPWHDKLRRIDWDQQQHKFLIYTDEGFVYLDEKIENAVQIHVSQPPVSVMGCNVFEQVNQGLYLVGSFSGLYLWAPETGMVVDAFTGQPPMTGTRGPISDHMMSGMVQVDNSHRLIVDYRSGLFSTSDEISLPAMPEQMIKQSPMSLWNVMLEIHTGRIFEHIMGSFYILFVPLTGLLLVAVVVSGFLIWLRRRNH